MQLYNMVTADNNSLPFLKIAESRFLNVLITENKGSSPYANYLYLAIMQRVHIFKTCWT